MSDSCVCRRIPKHILSACLNTTAIRLRFFVKYELLSQSLFVNILHCKRKWSFRDNKYINTARNVIIKKNMPWSNDGVILIEDYVPGQI